MAPADNKADAEGDGGGSTTDMSPPARRGINAVSVTVRGEVAVSTPAVSAALLPVSDCSSGMVTLRRGRDAPPVFDCMLLDREGGVNVVSGTAGTELRAPFPPYVPGPEWSDNGGEAVSFFRATDPASTDCDLLPGSSLIGAVSGMKDAKCCERIEPVSLIGVKMLYVLRWLFLRIAVSVSSDGWLGLLCGCAFGGSIGASGARSMVDS